jgi:putative CocE/NonD family hydrolase
MTGLTNPVKFLPNGLEIPMRDGVILRADVWRPDDDEPHPVILARTPYNKQLADPPRPWLKFASNGYTVVVQDCRGRWASDGHFVPFQDEIDDGYDTVEWIAEQDWCIGRIGMYGTSYLAATQWLAAVGAPPHLTTIVPAFTASDYHDGWIYHSGALLHSFAIGWALPFELGALERSDVPPERRPEVAAQIRAMLSDIAATTSHFPLKDVPVFSENGLGSYYFEWLEHPDEDDYWRRWSIEQHHDRITIPVLSFGGWYDMFLRGTIRNFTGLSANGNQRLVIGSWAHGKPLFGDNPDASISFGLAATGFDHEGLSLRWFDHWLKGEENGVMEDTPAVQYFTLGINRWESASEWPPPAGPVEYYLRTGGRLSTEPPGEEPTDVFVYDPRNPVPTHGGPAYGNGGARDQRWLEERPDVLVYTSEPLTADLKVTGPVVVQLWAATSARDTDFTAKLVDVRPDGVAINLADGIVRARYRNSLARQEFVEPGEVYEYTIDLDATSNVFRAGHRIRLEISSSNWPRFDPNPNTGGPFGEDVEGSPALQTVHHSAGKPSHVRLPILGA